MRTVRPLLAAACWAALCATAAPAQTTSDRAASILIYPKVVADESADTVVQLTSFAEARVDAFCSYVDGRDGWQIASFSVSLTREQPLHWTAARGRTPDGPEDPNAIPAAPAGFRGALLCVEVDGSGAPFSGNHLAGQATRLALPGGDAVAQPAVGLRAGGFVDGDDVLCLGDEPSDVCFIGEYEACPAAWLLAHPAEGAPDAQLGPGATQATRLTVVPCTQNLADAEAPTLAIEIAVTTALGERFTGIEIVTCWADLALADVSNALFDRMMLGSEVVQTRFTPAIGAGGFVLAAELERRADGVAAARTALPLHREGALAFPDAITLPLVRP